MMIPILDEIIRDAAAGGVQHVMIAMAHRGRLNVLAHILQKPCTQILAEFKDPLFARSARRSRLDGRREVPRRRARRGAPDGLPKSLSISMPPNPSHLEAVDPVLNGMARAAATAADPPGPADRRQGQGARHPDSRRRGVPRPGRRRRDAEPVAPRRLRGRRHHPHHRQQPARLHGRSGRVVQHQLRERPRARLQDSDHARQRRRSGGVHRGGAAGDGLPPPLQARLPDRSRRLSPLRPQRRRRAGVHAAADLPDRRRASDGAREATPSAGRGGEVTPRRRRDGEGT